MSCLSAVAAIWIVLLPGSGIAFLDQVPSAWRRSANNLPDTSSSALIHSTLSLAWTSSIAWLLVGAMTSVGAGFWPASICGNVECDNRTWPESPERLDQFDDSLP